MLGTLLPSAVATSAPGDLDPTFGAGGIVRLDLGGKDNAAALVRQPDGRIVLVGTSSGMLAAARLSGVDGAPDATFGGAGLGWRRYTIQGIAPQSGSAVQLQPDGRIVLAGSDSSGFVVRVGTDGSVDTGFGTAGEARFSIRGLFSEANALALQPDGKIVVAGLYFGGAYMGFAARLLDPQGTLDPGFASATGFSDFAKVVPNIKGVARQADGRLVVVGSNAALGTASNVVVGRVNVPSGLFDLSFNGKGWIARDTGGVDTASAVVLQPDGKILVVGASDVDGGDFFVARFMPDGTVDPSFAGGGSTVIAFGAQKSAASAVALQSDGKIVIAGAVTALTSDIGVVRLQPNGLADTTFGTNGRVTVDVGNDGAAGVVLEPDGKIVVAGHTATAGTSSDFLALRLQGDGVPVGEIPSLPPKCAGKVATVIGTAKRDLLVGTKGADVIVGLGGNDVLRGLGGNDVICGGDGNDRLVGGGGKDRLVGGRGKDRLEGGPAADVLVGGAGPDTLIGGLGKDVLNGGPGKDTQKQ